MNKQLVSASLWSLFSEIIAKVIGPLSFLILTRILSPSDFGIVAVATTILSFVYIVSDLGIGKVLIQASGGNPYLTKLNNAGFWINTFLGFFLASCMVLFSHTLARFFGNEQCFQIIRVMALQVLCYSLSAVQLANKKKNLEFKSLFYLRLITVGVPLVISVPLAFLGGGYWSIVSGQVVGAIMTTSVLWYNSKWKPTFSLDKSAVKSLLAKSCWNSLEQICVWIPIGLDTFLISNSLNSSQLGFYSTSRTLFSTAISLTMGPILPVMFSAFSKVQSEENALKRSLLSSQKLVCFLATFLGCGVFVFKELVEFILFNSKWLGISSIFGVTFLILCFEYILAPLEEGLRSKGMFHATAVNTLISTCLSIPVLFYSVDYGVFTYAVVRGLLTYLSAPGVIYFSSKVLKISGWDLLSNCKSILLCVGFILVVNWLISLESFSLLTRSIINGGAFLSAAVIALYSEKTELLKIKFYFTSRNT